MCYFYYRHDGQKPWTEGSTLHTKLYQQLEDVGRVIIDCCNAKQPIIFCKSNPLITVAGSPRNKLRSLERQVFYEWVDMGL
jgi:hypothetical protein